MAGPSNRRRILFLGGAAGVTGVVLRQLDPAELDPVLKPALDGPLSLYDLAVVDFDTLTEEQRKQVDQAASLASRTGILLVVGASNFNLAQGLLGKGRVAHVLVKPTTDYDGSHLLRGVTLMLKGTTPGLLPLLERGGYAEVASRLSTPQEKSAALDQGQSFAVQFGVSSRLASRLVDVTDELITNAFKHAFGAGAGSPGSGVEVSFGFDGRFLGVSVSDPKGSFPRSAAIKASVAGLSSLGGMVIDSAAGGGLGFSKLFQTVSELVIHLDPGRRTEIAGVINVDKGYRGLTLAGKTFHVCSTRGYGN